MSQRMETPPGHPQPATTVGRTPAARTRGQAPNSTAVEVPRSLSARVDSQDNWSACIASDSRIETVLVGRNAHHPMTRETETMVLSPDRLLLAGVIGNPTRATRTRIRMVCEICCGCREARRTPGVHRPSRTNPSHRHWYWCYYRSNNTDHRDDENDDADDVPARPHHARIFPAGGTSHWQSHRLRALTQHYHTQTCCADVHGHSPEQHSPAPSYSPGRCSVSHRPTATGTSIAPGLCPPQNPTHDTGFSCELPPRDCGSETWTEIGSESWAETGTGSWTVSGRGIWIGRETAGRGFEGTFS